MYIVNYKYNNIEKIGFLTTNKKNILSADTIFNKAGLKPPSNMNELISLSNDDIIKEINDTIENNDFDTIPLDDVVLLSPIPFTIRNMFCVGKNYLDHINELNTAKELKGKIPKLPIYFSKTSYPTVGPDSDIEIDWEASKEIDYEVELAVVIGEKGKNINREDAEKYIFGYTISNDISARDLQMSHIQWHKGKSLDNFSPLGPYIVHKSILPLPLDLNIQCKVNGELRQSSTTGNMIFDIPHLISNLSKGMTLYPGDIILTGTPSGVGMSFSPPKMLKPGDLVECEIENVGILRNKII